MYMFLHISLIDVLQIYDKLNIYISVKWKPNTYFRIIDPTNFVHLYLLRCLFT